MEVIKSYTGVYFYEMFLEFGNKIKETIGIIHCDDLYIVMRISEAVNTDYDIPIEKKHTKDYAKALEWYEEWYKELMWRIHNPC